MPKKFKGENTKVTAAKERKNQHKIETEAKKKADKERKESEEWAVGAKDISKKEIQKQKKEAQLAKKMEAARILEQEEKELSKFKPIINATGEEKKAMKRTQKHEKVSIEKREIPEFSASNIDDALDLLSIATDPSAMGGSSNITSALNSNSKVTIDRHPERRFKAALSAYEEREMPGIKKENPGLRYTQYRDLIYKNFQL
ncbi:1637_t:CDS:2 [Diversispora eburnea]|uniref:1637_t:CDS:1 n=1 Tax=Diversispora eburnea TaxID=1213867 RepID=A0A9N8VK63_9GLOM|nr:1637_t:CDS:2 [Diversispora eburnea]